MDVLRVKEMLERASRQSRLVVKVYRPGAIGGTPCVDVEAIHAGFDWDNGKLMISTAEQLTVLSPEDVEAIHESVRKGTSWHSYQAYKKVDDARRAAEAERDSYKADAERYRFLVDLGTDVALSFAIDPLAIASGIELTRPLTPDSLVAHADSLMKIAIEAGLWPLKKEGDVA